MSSDYIVFANAKYDLELLPVMYVPSATWGSVIGRKSVSLSLQ